MKYFNNTSIKAKLAALLASAALFGLFSQNALAVGTASSTPIDNIAKLSYSVGTVAQQEICSSPTGNTLGNGGTTGTTCTATVNGAGNTRVLVDNKVNLTVVGGPASVTPSTNQASNNAAAMLFTITNLGNTSQRYQLTPAYVSTTSAMVPPLSNAAIYLDDGATPGVFDGTNTPYVDASTFGDVVAGVAGTDLRVLLVVDAGTVSNTQNETWSLTATTVDAASTTVTTETNTGVVDDPTFVDVVFADAASAVAGDALGDGKAAAQDVFTVNGAVLTLTKTSAVYSDPVNGTTNPKAIPGAVITYTITIANGAGGATASSVTIADALGANLTFLPQFNDGVLTTCTGTQGIAVAGVCNSNGLDGDNADWNATTAGTVTVTGLSIAGGATTIIMFQATIN